MAEAIIDHYFPSSIDNQRFIKASFDFMRICDTLSSGSVAEVSLPVLGLGWVHKRMRLNGVELEQEVKVAIRSLAQRHGVYIDILRIAGNDLLIDALGPSFRHEAFVKKLKVAFLQKRG